MRLVACPDCHAQFDITRTDSERIRCHCGAVIDTTAPVPVDAEVRRCGSCGASVAPEATVCGYCGSAVVRDKGRLSLVCPECFARNEESARYCTGCGVKFNPQAPLPDGGEALACPVCEAVALVPRSIGGIRVLECPGCHGLWAPGESFDVLINKAVEVHRARVAAGGLAVHEPAKHTAFQSKIVYRKCPECGGFMQRKNFGRKSGVIVDWCGEHGTWLDADELQDIAAFVAAGGLRDAPGAEPTGDEERIKAVFTAEKLMAGKRSRLRRKRGLLRDDPTSLGTLGDFLTGLLG